MAVLGALKNSGIELDVIDLGIITHVVPRKNNDVTITKCEGPSTHCACAKWNKKRKRKRRADCANRTSWWNHRFVVVLFQGIILPEGLRGVEGLFLSHTRGKRTTRRATANAVPAIKFQIFRVEQVRGNEVIALWVLPKVRSPSYLSM